MATSMSQVTADVSAENASEQRVDFNTNKCDDIIWISNLKLTCVVGCNADERGHVQPVVLTLGLHVNLTECGSTDDVALTVNYAIVAKRVCKYVETAGCYTLEALATGIIRLIFSMPECVRVGRVTIRVDKPKAFRSIIAIPGVQITRDRNAVLTAIPQSATKPTLRGTERPTMPVKVYLAIGSNVGDRFQNFEIALNKLQQHKTVHVEDVSWLYETPAAYVTDQPAFLNAAIAATTTLSPNELLQHIKMNVEAAMGRSTGGIRYGPRIIDVDILFYGDACIEEGEITGVNSTAVVIPHGDTESNAKAPNSPLPLEIPHPRIAERGFVLGPLNDLCPDYVHPTLHTPIRLLFAKLPREQRHLQRVIPLPPRFPPRSSLLSSDARHAEESVSTLLPVGGPRTLLMGIINVTPDSFSDGGVAFSTPDAVRQGVALAEAGAAIIDVGGQSTRPGATRVSAEDELARILPVVSALRTALPPSVAISVDTFYASVASAAVEAGASIINDVSGGTRDPNMLQIVARLRVPIVLMHMRGDADTMQSLTHYDNGVVRDVLRVLQERADAARAAGVRRWSIVLDPGIGFAKTPAHNFALLRRSGALANALGYPLLYGPSRKRFIGVASGVKEPHERVWGTAAAITACIAVGADIVRVHDVSQMRDVVAVADAIFRSDVDETDVPDDI